MHQDTGLRVSKMPVIMSVLALGGMQSGSLSQSIMAKLGLRSLLSRR